MAARGDQSDVPSSEEAIAQPDYHNRSIANIVIIIGTLHMSYHIMLSLFYVCLFSIFFFQLYDMICVNWNNSYADGGASSGE